MFLIFVLYSLILLPVGGCSNNTSTIFNFKTGDIDYIKVDYVPDDGRGRMTATIRDKTEIADFIEAANAFRFTKVTRIPAGVDGVTYYVYVYNQKNEEVFIIYPYNMGLGIYDQTENTLYIYDSDEPSPLDWAYCKGLIDKYGSPMSP